MNNQETETLQRFKDYAEAQLAVHSEKIKTNNAEKDPTAAPKEPLDLHIERYSKELEEKLQELALKDTSGLKDKLEVLKLHYLGKLIE